MPSPVCVLRISATLALVATPALAQQRPQVLDTLVAVASRTRPCPAVRATTVITQADIARSTARNLADLLGAQLGVDVYGRSAAQADISLRGSTAEQTLILVDGIRMSDVQSAHYALDLAMPLASIERVEILHGGGSALYGSDAVGGVINIVTRRGALPPAAHARGGSFGTYGAGATAGMTLGTTTISGSTAYEQSNGARAGTDYRIGEGRLSLGTPVGAGQLEGNIGVGIRDFDANAFYAPYNSAERTGSYTADARWRATVGSWSLSTTASTRRHTDRFTLVKENPALYQNQHTSWQHTGEIVARTAIAGTVVALGAEATRATLASNRLGARGESRGALFAEVAVDPSPTSTLTVGLRGDRTSTYGGFLSPSVALALPLSSVGRLHGSVSRGFRAPSWTERYYADPTSIGNADLISEAFWTGDLGIRIVGARGLVMDVTGFARRAENLIDWVKPVNAPAGTRWAATNIGEAHYRGIEATLAVALSSSLHASLAGSALHFRNAQGDGLAGKYALRPVTRQFISRVSYSPPGAFRTSVELVGARRATEPGHITGNARAEWRPGRIGLTLDLTNLGDAEWLDASGEVVAGRGLYLGVTWQ